MPGWPWVLAASWWGGVGGGGVSPMLLYVCMHACPAIWGCVERDVPCDGHAWAEISQVDASLA
jgi:hypothetical protein